MLSPHSEPATPRRRRGRPTRPIVTIEDVIALANAGEQRRLFVADLARISDFSKDKITSDIKYGLLAADEVLGGPPHKRTMVYRISCREAVRYFKTMGLISN